MRAIVVQKLFSFFFEKMAVTRVVGRAQKNKTVFYKRCLKDYKRHLARRRWQAEFWRFNFFAAYILFSSIDKNNLLKSKNLHGTKNCKKIGQHFLFKVFGDMIKLDAVLRTGFQSPHTQIFDFYDIRQMLKAPLLIPGTYAFSVL